ncbi:unnamed protein product [Bursaphelenchus okinawaensis]|uniref:Uncharacterized protein n=1 Tax=Bursaphelenchus okinawaensis TaxID=465554 RepID=A0A811KBV5_9BILA|nr:unnamed protein product [Bursaphelenchus okinawaensis]CAG9097373.1 unnamed protein product [Bursaphelenchus okinawaensis]
MSQASTSKETDQLNTEIVIDSDHDNAEVHQSPSQPTTSQDEPSLESASSKPQEDKSDSSDEEMEVDQQKSDASSSSDTSDTSFDSDEDEESSESDESDDEPEVPNVFLNFKVGSAYSELEDQRFLVMFKDFKRLFNEWKDDTTNIVKRDAFFDKVHECMLQPSYNRLVKNEKSFEWPKSRRKKDVVDKKDEMLCAYCQIQSVLSRVSCNPLTHLIQMAMITPNNKDIWLRIVKAAASYGDVKMGAFACKRLALLGEGRKANERLIVMYYGLCRFPECLLAIRDCLKTWPDNQVALVLLDQILSLPLSLKETLDKIMYENLISTKQYYKVNEKAKKRVMEMVQRFRAKVAESAKKEAIDLTQDGRFYQVDLDENDLNFDVFAKKLKKIYDNLSYRLETKVSMVYKVPEKFEEEQEEIEQDQVVEQQETQEEQQEQDVEMESEASTSSEESEEEDESQTSQDEQLLDEEIIQKVVDDMIQQIVQKEGHKDGPDDDRGEKNGSAGKENGDEGEKDGFEGKKEEKNGAEADGNEKTVLKRNLEYMFLIDEASEDSEASIRNYQDTRDENEPPAKKKKKLQKFATRRSTRFVEEIEDTPFSSMPVVIETYNIRKCLNVEKEGELQLTESSNTYYLRLKPPSQQGTLTKLSTKLRMYKFLNSLLDDMDKTSNGLTFVSILDRFLSFVATEALKRRVKFEKDEKIMFCYFYTLWKTLRTKGNNKKRSRNPMKIHLLAAEFGNQQAQDLMNYQLTCDLKDKATTSKSTMNITPLLDLKIETELKNCNDKMLKLLVAAQKSVLREKDGLDSNVKYQKWKNRALDGDMEKELASEDARKSLATESVRKDLGASGCTTGNNEASKGATESNDASESVDKNTEVLEVDKDKKSDLYAKDERFNQPSTSSEMPKSFMDEFVELGGDPATNFGLEKAMKSKVYCSFEVPESLNKDLEDGSVMDKIRYHWTRALQSRFRPTTEPLEKKIERKTEQYHLIRIFKLIDTLSEDQRQKLKSITSYFTPTTPTVSTEFSTETAVRRFTQNYKNDMDNYIMYLISQKALNSIGSREQVVETVWHYFDWSKLQAQDKYECWRLVFKAFNEKKAYGELFKMAISGLEDVLKNKITFNKSALESLEFFLEQIENCLSDITQQDKTQLKLILVALSEKFAYRTNLRLWKIVYKMVQLDDPKSTEELNEFLTKMKRVKDRLPLMSLIALREAHDLMGQEKRCGFEQGEFLLFCLNEYCNAFESLLLTDFFALETEESEDLKLNMEREMLQLFSCYTGQLVKCRLRLQDHSQNDKRTSLPFAVVQRILQLVLPKELPLFDDQISLKTEVMEFIKIVQNELESSLTPEHVEEFKNFVEKNHNFKPEFKFEKDGTLLPISTIHEGRNLLDWPKLTELSKERAIVTSKSLYLQAFYQYRNTSRDLRKTAYQILLMSDVLTKELQSSVWIMLAKSGIGNSNGRIENADALLFPFRMSLLLKMDCAEGHLDLGSIMYQIHALNSRQLRQTSSSPEKRKKLEEQHQLIRTCHTHFLLADRFKTEAIDIGWLCSYFAGKAAEKLGHSVDSVMDHYTECAKRLHEDQYMFVNKISKKTQMHLEPMELFYRVHAYLGKRFYEVKEMNSQNVAYRRKILRYLQYFSTYGASKIPDSSMKFKGFRNFFSSTPTAYDTTLDIVDKVCKTEEEEDGIECLMDGVSMNDVEGVVKEMTEWVEMEIEAKKLLTSAYESILAKFPHYKAAYRLAELQMKEGNTVKCVRTLMEFVFKAQKRVSVNSNIFLDIVEIHRSDFERNKSLFYHISRCLDLFLKALIRNNDLGHVIVTLHSIVNPSFSANDYLLPETLTETIKRCFIIIKNMFNNPRNEWATHFETYEAVLQSAVQHITHQGIKFDPELAKQLGAALGTIKNYFRHKIPQRPQVMSRPPHITKAVPQPQLSPRPPTTITPVSQKSITIPRPPPTTFNSASTSLKTMTGSLKSASSPKTASDLVNQILASRNKNLSAIQNLISQSQAAKNQNPASSQSPASWIQNPASIQSPASRVQNSASSQSPASRIQNPASSQTLSARNQNLASSIQNPASTQNPASKSPHPTSSQSPAARSVDTNQNLASTSQISASAAKMIESSVAIKALLKKLNITSLDSQPEFIRLLSKCSNNDPKVFEALLRKFVEDQGAQKRPLPAETPKRKTGEPPRKMAKTAITRATPILNKTSVSSSASPLAAFGSTASSLAVNATTASETLSAFTNGSAAERTGSSSPDDIVILSSNTTNSDKSKDVSKNDTLKNPSLKQRSSKSPVALSKDDLPKNGSTSSRSSKSPNPTTKKATASNSATQDHDMPTEGTSTSKASEAKTSEASKSSSTSSKPSSTMMNLQNMNAQDLQNALLSLQMNNLANQMSQADMLKAMTAASNQKGFWDNYKKVFEAMSKTASGPNKQSGATAASAVTSGGTGGANTSTDGTGGANKVSGSTVGATTTSSVTVGSIGSATSSASAAGPTVTSSKENGSTSATNKQNGSSLTSSTASMTTVMNSTGSKPIATSATSSVPSRTSINPSVVSTSSPLYKLKPTSMAMAEILKNATASTKGGLSSSTASGALNSLSKQSSIVASGAQKKPSISASGVQKAPSVSTSGAKQTPSTSVAKQSLSSSTPGAKQSISSAQSTSTLAKQPMGMELMMKLALIMKKPANTWTSEEGHLVKTRLAEAQKYFLETSLGKLPNQTGSDKSVSKSTASTTIHQASSKTSTVPTLTSSAQKTTGNSIYSHNSSLDSMPILQPSTGTTKTTGNKNIPQTITTSTKSTELAADAKNSNNGATTGTNSPKVPNLSSATKANLQNVTTTANVTTSLKSTTKSSSMPFNMSILNSLASTTNPSTLAAAMNSMMQNPGNNTMVSLQLAKLKELMDKQKADEATQQVQKLKQAQDKQKEMEMKKKEEIEKKQQALLEFQKKEEERRNQIAQEKAAKEAEKKRKQEEEKQRKLAEKQAEAQRKAAEKQAEQDRKRQAAEYERQRRAEEERQRQEERRRQIEAAEQLRAEEERRRIAEEERRAEAERRREEMEQRKMLAEEEARAVESMKSLIDDDQRSTNTDESECVEEERRRMLEEERRKKVEVERLKALEKRKQLQERLQAENKKKMEDERAREARQAQQKARQAEETTRTQNIGIEAQEKPREGYKKDKEVEEEMQYTVEGNERAINNRDVNISFGNHQQAQLGQSGNWDQAGKRKTSQSTTISGQNASISTQNSSFSGQNPTCLTQNSSHFGSQPSFPAQNQSQQETESPSTDYVIGSQTQEYINNFKQIKQESLADFGMDFNLDNQMQDLLDPVPEKKPKMMTNPGYSSQNQSYSSQQGSEGSYVTQPGTQEGYRNQQTSQGDYSNQQTSQGGYSSQQSGQGGYNNQQGAQGNQGQSYSNQQTSGVMYGNQQSFNFSNQPVQSFNYSNPAQNSNIQSQSYSKQAYANQPNTYRSPQGVQYQMGQQNTSPIMVQGGTPKGLVPNQQRVPNQMVPNPQISSYSPNAQKVYQARQLNCSNPEPTFNTPQVPQGPRTGAYGTSNVNKSPGMIQKSPMNPGSTGSSGVPVSPLSTHSTSMRMSVGQIGRDGSMSGTMGGNGSGMSGAMNSMSSNVNIMSTTANVMSTNTMSTNPRTMPAPSMTDNRSRPHMKRQNAVDSPVGVVPNSPQIGSNQSSPFAQPQRRPSWSNSSFDNQNSPYPNQMMMNMSPMNTNSPQNVQMIRQRSTPQVQQAIQMQNSSNSNVLQGQMGGTGYGNTSGYDTNSNGGYDVTGSNNMGSVGSNNMGGTSIGNNTLSTIRTGNSIMGINNPGNSSMATTNLSTSNRTLANIQDGTPYSQARSNYSTTGNSAMVQGRNVSQNINLTQKSAQNLIQGQNQMIGNANNMMNNQITHSASSYAYNNSNFNQNSQSNANFNQSLNHNGAISAALQRPTNPGQMRQFVSNPMQHTQMGRNTMQQQNVTNQNKTNTSYSAGMNMQQGNGANNAISPQFQTNVSSNNSNWPQGSNNFYQNYYG